MRDPAHQMKQNEVRAVFRVTAAILAVLAWPVVLGLLFIAIQNPSWTMQEFWFLFVAVWLAVTFSVVAFRGYVPRFLLSLLPHPGGFGVRGVDEKDLR